MCRPVQAEVETVDVPRLERLTDQEAVAVLGTTCPAPHGPVLPLPCCADQPILLHHEDDFLESQHVGLEDGHVGEQER